MPGKDSIILIWTSRNSLDFEEQMVIESLKKRWDYFIEHFVGEKNQ